MLVPLPLGGGGGADILLSVGLSSIDQAFTVVGHRPFGKPAFISIAVSEIFSRKNRRS
jgi:hypothetical protein